MNKAKTKLFAKIAKIAFGIETLQERKSDRLDFHNVSVMSLQEALDSAYEMGKEAGRAKAYKDLLPPLKARPVSEKRCSGGCGNCHCK